MSEQLVDPDNQFRLHLQDRKLKFQRCLRCAHGWMPAAPECPNCLNADYEWEESSGKAKLVSWVVYHRAYDPSVAHKLPYNVALVELAEGPRLVSNVTGIDDPETLVIDEPLLFEPVWSEDGWITGFHRPS